MGNLSTNGARIAAIVVAVASIAYGLIPRELASYSCGSVLIPGEASGHQACSSLLSTSLLWVIIVVSVAAAIYLTVKDNDENS